jgi:hypothetical protein
VLGQSAGAIHVGEARNLWDDGLLLGRRCGCGLDFRVCPFWTKVVEAIQVETGAFDARRIANLRDSLARTRGAAQWFGRRSRKMTRRIDDLLPYLVSAYRAMAKVGNAFVVVDSSMSPTYGRLLMESKQLDVQVLHLIRDPRAVVNAWTRSGYQDPVARIEMHRYSTRQSVGRWIVENWLVNRLLGPPASTIRYEDFAANPRLIANCVWRGAGLEPAFIGPDNSVDLDVSHTVWGNPSRFDSGRVVIRDDRRWHVEMSRGDRRIVNIMTSPWLHKYGYTSDPTDAP